MNRRVLLLNTLAGASAVLVSACGGTAAPASPAATIAPAGSPTTNPTEAPAASATAVATTVPSGSPTANPAATAATSPAPNKAGPTTMRIAYQRGGIALIAKFRGEVQKNLASNGITLEWVGPFPDAPTGYEALRANSGDFFSSATAPAVSSLAGGNPFKIVAGTPGSAQGNAFLVYKDSPAQTVHDLIGKKVAVQRGNVAEYAFLKTLEKEGIPKDQIERVYIAAPDAAVALAQQKVDAWVTWDPYIAIAQVQSGARIIADGSAAPDYGIWTVRNDLVSSQPDAVRSVLVALQQEGVWANANVATALHIEGDELKLPSAVVDRMATRPPNFNIDSIDDKTLRTIQQVANWFHDAGVVPSAVDLSKAVVFDMVKR